MPKEFILAWVIRAGITFLEPVQPWVWGGTVVDQRELGRRDLELLVPVAWDSNLLIHASPPGAQPSLRRMASPWSWKGFERWTGLSVSQGLFLISTLLPWNPPTSVSRHPQNHTLHRVWQMSGGEDKGRRGSSRPQPGKNFSRAVCPSSQVGHEEMLPPRGRFL